jgi:hypothetical protein
MLNMIYYVFRTLNKLVLNMIYYKHCTLLKCIMYGRLCSYHST